MQIDLGIFPEKVPTIIGYKDVVVFQRVRDQAPVRPTALANVGDIVGVKSFLLRNCSQTNTEALVNQKPTAQSADPADPPSFLSNPDRRSPQPTLSRRRCRQPEDLDSLQKFLGCCAQLANK